MSGNDQVYQLNYEMGSYLLPNGNEYTQALYIKTGFFDSNGWELYVDYNAVINNNPIYGMIAKDAVNGGGQNYNGAIFDGSGNVVYDENNKTLVSQLSSSFINSNLVIEYDHPGSEHFSLYDESGQEVFWNDVEGWYVDSNGNVLQTDFTLFTGPDALGGTSTMVYDGTSWGEWEYNQDSMTWEPLP